MLLGGLDVLLGGLGVVLEPLEWVLGGFGSSWWILWGSLGRSLEGLGSQLGRSGVVVGDPGEVLGCSWDRFGRWQR